MTGLLGGVTVGVLLHGWWLGSVTFGVLLHGWVVQESHV
jgi:hypothetical protein